MIIKGLGKDRLRGELAVHVRAIRSARCRSENPLSERRASSSEPVTKRCADERPSKLTMHVLDYRSGTSFSQAQLAATARAPRATHAALAPPVRWLGSEGKEGADVRSWQATEQR